jgi:hypothetical protein
MNVSPLAPVPFDCSVQLGGGNGTACYFNWGQVADCLLGIGNRRVLNQWARNTFGVWFIRNPDEQNTAVFEVHSQRGFKRCFTMADEPVYDMLLLRISLTHTGEVFGYEVQPCGVR